MALLQEVIPGYGTEKTFVVAQSQWMLGTFFFKKGEAEKWTLGVKENAV